MRIYTIELRFENDLTDKQHETIKMQVLRAARGLNEATQPTEIAVWGDDFFKGREDIEL